MFGAKPRIAWCCFNAGKRSHPSSVYTVTSCTGGLRTIERTARERMFWPYFYALYRVPTIAADFRSTLDAAQSYSLPPVAAKSRQLLRHSTDAPKAARQLPFLASSPFPLFASRCRSKLLLKGRPLPPAAHNLPFPLFSVYCSQLPLIAT